ncbi:hypothetical protein UB44_21555 [Burkholderiaceae bacterium 26]|nr:hypothetical protein UB44_21555 [Burkholderiaceae bacterium 26]
MPYNKGPDRLGAAWAVDMQAHLPERRLAEATRLMAWARDRKTGAPRYILELDENHRGAHCDCECVSCGGALIAVNAARETYLRRPHFRHAAGTEKHLCLVLAARAALLATLESTGYLDLPSHRRTARITGLSGSFYDAWVDAPSERVHIASCSFSDEAAAIVTLDDGRELHVVLVGSHASGTDGAQHAAIEVLVDDVALAGMSPEELRHRTRLLVSRAQWCGHWQDNVLLDSAMNQARARAADAFDLVDGETGLPDAATPQEIRETLLHRKAKEILEREKRLMVPQMSVTERSQQWPQEATTRKCRDAQALELQSVALEQRMGRIIPDVTAVTVVRRWGVGAAARSVDPSPPPGLLHGRVVHLTVGSTPRALRMTDRLGLQIQPVDATH